jgi:autotransporter-associated beta strand protein
MKPVSVLQISVRLVPMFVSHRTAFKSIKPKTMKSKKHHLAFLTTAGSLIATGFVYSQTIEIDPAAPVPATHTLVKAWEFNTPGDLEGWVGNGFGSVSNPLVVSGGVVSGPITNDDSQFGTSFTALTQGYSTIVEYALTVDPLAAVSTGGTFFWGDFSGGIAGSRGRPVVAIDNNAPRVVRVTFNGGVKNLNQLRIDPASAGNPKTASFDYVRVYHYQPTTFGSVTLTASDAPGASSMITGTNWSNTAPPAAENNYFTGAFQLRTPANTSLHPFGGSALSVDTGGSILFKGIGTMEVRQLTLAGGALMHGDTGTAAPSNIARLYVADGIDVTAASLIDTVGANRFIEINGILSGSSNLEIKGVAPTAGTSAGTVTLKSASPGYTGTFTVNNSWLDLDHDNAISAASVIVNSGGQLRRVGTDADGTTTIGPITITGSGNTLGNESSRGAIYFGRDGLNATLDAPVSVSGASARIGTYSAGSNLTLGGALSGAGTLQLWGGGGAETHVQRFILNGASTLDGQTDLLSEFGAQAHLRLGGDDRLATNRRLRMSATWGGSTEGAGAFFDLNGFNQTLSNLQLDGTKRKYIQNTSTTASSILTLSGNTNAFDTNGGNVYIENVTITHTGAVADSGVQIDNASVVTVNNSTWNAPFYSSLGNAGAGTLILNNSSFIFGGELLIGRNGQNGTLVVNAGSIASSPNLFRIGDSPAAIATVNLKGGTLASSRFFNNSTGTSILNLDGGTLRATANNTVDWIEGGSNGVTTNILDEGITLDSNGFNVVAVADLLEDPVFAGGGVTKTGLGNVRMTGVNTYKGVTNINQGNLIIDGNHSAATGAINVALDAGLGGDGTINGATFAAGAKLPWTVSDWNAAPTLDAGVVTINGELAIDLSENALANFSESNKTFTILSASSLSVANPALLSVNPVGFTSGSGSWSVQVNGNTLELVYTAGSASPYETWLTGYPSITGSNRAPNVDFDSDGVPNGIEFMTGTSPADAGAADHPAVSTNPGGDLIVTFKRVDAAEVYNVFVDTNTSLSGAWTAIPVPTGAVTGPPINVVDNDAAPDDITATIPAAGDPKKFARVKIDIPFTP